ncbi:MAG: glycosyltransferase, partial [Candidatus Hydrogenedentota bacterium]
TDWTAEALEARSRWGIPLAVMVWDNIPFNMERDPGRRTLKARTAELADRFIVYTDRSRRMLRLEGVPDAKIRRIYPGVNTERFCPGPADRAKLDLDDDEFVILFVGWLLPRKGIDYLLLALRELLNDPELRGRRVRLLIVGSGPGRVRVEGLLDRLKLKEVCTFTGSLPYGRMPEVYRAADVFVLPSIAIPEWQEQFGMSLIEAMAAGTPVVSTMSGAIPEIADYAAALCQPNDFVSLYEALKNMILYPDRRKDLGKAGRKRALNHFQLRNHIEELLRIYREMTQE